MEEKQGIVLTKKKLAVIVIVVLLLVIGGVAFGLNWNNWFGGGTDATPPDSPDTSDTAGQPDLDENAVDWQGEQPDSKPQTADGQAGIAIPGYKSIALKADQAQQRINLYNPEVNDCYFVMSLLLPDGTELWRSKMVAPGKGLYEITLSQTVPAGTYENSTLKYECYKMDDSLTPLNGGEVKLTLEVE